MSAHAEAVAWRRLAELLDSREVRMDRGLCALFPNSSEIPEWLSDSYLYRVMQLRLARHFVEMWADTGDGFIDHAGYVEPRVYACLFLALECDDEVNDA